MSEVLDMKRAGWKRAKTVNDFDIKQWLEEKKGKLGGGEEKVHCIGRISFHIREKDVDFTWKICNKYSYIINQTTHHSCFVI